MRKKLVKICEDSYQIVLDGAPTEAMSLTWIKDNADTYGIRSDQIDMAVQEMEIKNHEVADFGINGYFIITQTLEEADLGHDLKKPYKEAQ